MEPMKLNIQMFAPDLPTDQLVNFKFVGVENPPSQIKVYFYQRYSVDLEPTEFTVDLVNGEASLERDVLLPLRKIVIGDGSLYSATWTEDQSQTESQLGVTNVYIYSNDTFTGKILSDNVNNITPLSGYSTNYNPHFSQVATTDEGLFTENDDYGITTYFRGAVTNNYVKFANFWWRIIRINGDGSIRLLYAGTSATDTAAFISTSTKYNLNNNNSSYVGYMYTLNQQYGTGTNSSIKTVVDSWYVDNLSKFDKYISKTAEFCNDRTVGSGTWGSGGDAFHYAAFTRLYTNKTPTFTCSNANDRFTASTSTGNGKLTYPIGLITADEVAYAGGVWNTANSSYYIAQNASSGARYWWTMSPGTWSFTASVFFVGGSSTAGHLYNDWVRNAYGVRPVINLKGNLSVIGNGTSDSPYEIALNVAFNNVKLLNIYYNDIKINKMYYNGTLVFKREGGHGHG